MSRTTLKDVAKQAGVSFKTVSRVINHEPNVSASTTEKVNRAIAELNYVPNSAARSLSRGKAMAIGLVTGWPVNTPYTSALIEKTLDECIHNGYSMALFAMGKDLVKKIMVAYRGRQVDGIVLDTNAAEDEELISQLNALSVPYVVIHPNRKNGLTRASFVRIDNTESAKLAVNYLIELGHCAIGYVSYRSGLNQEDERFLGYCQALSDAGLPICKEWVFEGHSSEYQVEVSGAFHVGFNGAKQLIQNHPELTAIFTEIDEIALGVLNAIWQMGLKIPDDISVIGFDDISYATMITPPLTTIHQPIDQIASTAVKQLIRAIDDPLTPPIDLILPTNLVIRDSCKPPRREPIAVTVK